MRIGAALTRDAQPARSPASLAADLALNRNGTGTIALDLTERHQALLPRAAGRTSGPGASRTPSRRCAASPTPSGWPRCSPTPRRRASACWPSRAAGMRPAVAGGRVGGPMRAATAKSGATARDHLPAAAARHGAAGRRQPRARRPMPASPTARWRRSRSTARSSRSGSSTSSPTSSGAAQILDANGTLIADLPPTQGGFIAGVWRAVRLRAPARPASIPTRRCA